MFWLSNHKNDSIFTNIAQRYSLGQWRHDDTSRDVAVPLKYKFRSQTEVSGIKVSAHVRGGDDLLRRDGQWQLDPLQRDLG